MSLLPIIRDEETLLPFKFHINSSRFFVMYFVRVFLFCPLGLEIIYYLLWVKLLFPILDEDDKENGLNADRFDTVH